MTTTRPLRLLGIDRLRGLVIVLMALDHVRDYYSPTMYAPEDLDQSSVELFLTRWITHFCAPVFVFLAGAGAWLYRCGGGRDNGDLGRFLAVRGLWLIALELVIINPSWDGNPFSFFLLQVIWAIGWSMLVLALLVQGPRWLPLAVGLVIVVGHNLLDPLTPAQFGAAAPLWTVLHEGGWLSRERFGGVLVAYPLLPWIGVMALGYGLAPWLAAGSDRRPGLFRVGLAMTALFVALRLSNLYGDGSTWSADPRGPLWSTLAALNVEKYPPSLLFVLMTLGPALMLLALLERLPAIACAGCRCSVACRCSSTSCICR